MDKRLEAGSMLPRPASTLYRITSLPPPPPPPKDEGYRPSTATTRRTSYSTTMSTRKTIIKYAAPGGRFAGTELSPQPSDDADDPLNWHQWKKELNLAALLLTACLASAMKTALIPANAELVSRYQTSYSAVVALTAAPLLVSAFSGMGSVVAAKVVGKRPVYLVSTVLMFVGSMWGMRTLGSYREAMAARVFQGLGWGAFDTLVLGSIYDTFFEHERGLRITAYNLLSTTITWGAPLFGGLASRNSGRFTVQFEIINSFFAIALPLLALGTAESNFDHAWSVSLQTPSTTRQFGTPNLIPRGPLRISKEDVMAYLKSIPPWGYRGFADTHTLLQAPRATVAPTTVLVAAATAIPHAALWSMAGTLALVFPRLSEAGLGSLMTGPVLFSAAIVAVSWLYRPYHARFNTVVNLVTLAAGTVLFLTGVLSFGLMTSKGLLSAETGDGSFNYPLLSFLLGLLAAGSATLDATVSPLIYSSSQYISSNLYACLRNSADMTAGVTALRTVVAGVVLQTVASAVEDGRGALAPNVTGLAGGQVLLAVVVGGIWAVFGEAVRRWDGRAMGLVDLSMLRKGGSFFEYD
ncbi:uncharacterized protein DNG_01441 [Cephalotrichum gorgonifer]|uniref:MFS_1 domain-containing protein n=1 Tax=Cephalotrichum gorgonifer TaxID=2041049 RepID=A0AAE8MT13_9PEZI|nr:uncharacterized protein DNG_01441 [Cephalotrichum gorgonifer]